ncbi:MAG TPA: L-seryl-tRNA(Sec) selenium transferase [Syntrophobacteria bacterium]|nr:L-seryl-tRNA(Sec) selenium transferase [Syntrophobacteria bacterium]
METSHLQDLLRRLPAVDELLRHPLIAEAAETFPRPLVVQAVRNVLDRIRRAIVNDQASEASRIPDGAVLVQEILAEAEGLAAYTLQRVVNGTGIIVHTNLGRSLLCQEALERLQLIGSAYSNLEYDLEAGSRGSRYVHTEAILREITGADGALVVNNNAGAVLLVLNTLAQGREVVVSRGELVEIGGSFRIPDVMTRSGARLREVGCTNRTHLEDYRAAIGPETALLLKVHASNYQITGFTAEVDLVTLVALGRAHNLPVMEDLGSGCFVDLSRFGLRGEPVVQDSVRSGADVITFSGDKLLGGPQAGIILGRKEIMERLRRSPLTRALRVDKFTLAALEATLRLYREEETAVRGIPTLRMIALDVDTLATRAQILAERIREVVGSGVEVAVVDGASQVGGGALPVQNLPSKLVALASRRLSAARLEGIFRGNRPPIIGRVEQERFLLDVRTLQPGDDEVIVAAAARLVAV